MLKFILFLYVKTVIIVKAITIKLRQNRHSKQTSCDIPVMIYLKKKIN